MVNLFDRENKEFLEQEKLLEIERNHPHYEPIIAYILKEEMKSENKFDEKYIKQGEVYDWLKSLIDK